MRERSPQSNVSSRRRCRSRNALVRQRPHVKTQGTARATPWNSRTTTLRTQRTGRKVIATHKARMAATRRGKGGLAKFHCSVEGTGIPARVRNLSSHPPIWRLFLFAQKAHTLFAENQQARKLRSANEPSAGGTEPARRQPAPIVTEIIRSSTFTFFFHGDRLWAEAKDKGVHLYPVTATHADGRAGRKSPGWKARKAPRIGVTSSGMAARTFSALRR